MKKNRYTYNKVLKVINLIRSDKEVKYLLSYKKNIDSIIQDSLQKVPLIS